MPTTIHSSTNPTDSARFHLFNVLIGIAITLSVDGLLREGKSFSIYSSLSINTASFLLLAVLFYHGKIATTQSSDHLRSLKGRPTVALIDYMLHFLVVMSIVFGAFLLSDMRSYTGFNLFLRLADFVLVLFLSIFVSPFSSQLELRAQISWLTFNLVSAAIYATVYLHYDATISTLAFVTTKILPVSFVDNAARAEPEQLGQMILAFLFLLIIVFDAIMDSTLNRRYYAG